MIEQRRLLVGCQHVQRGGRDQFLSSLTIDFHTEFTFVNNYVDGRVLDCCRCSSNVRVQAAQLVAQFLHPQPHASFDGSQRLADLVGNFLLRQPAEVRQF